MAGVTDVTFRGLCLEQGAALAASEMISSDTSVYATDKTRHRIKRATGDTLHTVQIAGSDPEVMASAARFNVGLGAEVIDINMGCPAKKVCKKLAGSALLSDEPLVEKILHSVVSAVDVPVTLKIRTGPSREQRNGVAIAKIAEASGIQCLAVHGRTRADKFTGVAEYQTIRSIKQAVSIPVIANGDIVDGPSALDVMQQTGCDGLMIGRAAQGNPFIFREIQAYLDAVGTVETITNPTTVPTAVSDNIDQASSSSPLQAGALAKPSDEEICDVLTKHLQGIYLQYGEYRGVRIARKHISWYLKNKPGASKFRALANTVETASEQLHLVNSFFDQRTFS